MVTIMNCSRLFVCIAYLKRFVFRAITFCWSGDYEDFLPCLCRIDMTPRESTSSQFGRDRFHWIVNSRLLLAGEMIQSQDMEQHPWRIQHLWFLEVSDWGQRRHSEKSVEAKISKSGLGWNHSKRLSVWVSLQGFSTPSKIAIKHTSYFWKSANSTFIEWRDCFINLAPRLYSYIQTRTSDLLVIIVSLHVSSKSYSYVCVCQRWGLHHLRNIKTQSLDIKRKFVHQTQVCLVFW